MHSCKIVKVKFIRFKLKFCSNLKMNQVLTYNLFIYEIDIPATGMYFMTYEYFQKLLTPAVPATGKMGQVSFFSTVFAGGMAGVSSWILGMPADVLKSRLQSGT